MTEDKSMVKSDQCLQLFFLTATAAITGTKEIGFFLYLNC